MYATFQVSWDFMRWEIRKFINGDYENLKGGIRMFIDRQSSDPE